jgi:hypothetical protein
VFRIVQGRKKFAVQECEVREKQALIGNKIQKWRSGGGIEGKEIDEISFFGKDSWELGAEDSAAIDEIRKRRRSGWRRKEKEMAESGRKMGIVGRVKGFSAGKDHEIECDIIVAVSKL